MVQAKYKTIYNYLKEQIQCGNLTGRIPSEIDMAKLFRVSRMTARKGIELLIYENLLYQVPRSGTFVVEQSQKIEVHLDNSYAFKRQQTDINTVVDNFQIINASEYHQQLFNLTEQDTLYKFSRKRYKNNNLFAYELGLIPTKFLNLTSQMLEGSLGELFENNKFNINKIEKEYKAVIPDSEIASVFNSTMAIFAVDFLRYLSSGELLEFITVYYNQHLCKFIQTVEKKN